jgi:hypothetical protein
MRVKFANAEVDIWKLRKGVVVEYFSNFYHIDLLGVVDCLEQDMFRLPLFCKNSVHKEGRWLFSDTIDWLEPH